MRITRSTKIHLLKTASTFFLVILFTLFFSRPILAQTYGEGNYGGSGDNTLYGGGGGPSGDGGSDGSGSNDGGGSSGSLSNGGNNDDSDKNDHSCTDTKPGENAPQITQAKVSKGDKTITIYFSSGAGPRKEFEIRYTTNINDFSGVKYYKITSDRNSYDYTVDVASTNQDYYLKVRAVNGCAEGPYSKTQIVKFDGDQTIGTTTYTYEPPELRSGIEDAAGRASEQPQIDPETTGSSGSGGTINSSDNENASEDSADHNPNQNPLKNNYLIFGVIIFLIIGIVFVWWFIV